MARLTASQGSRLAKALPGGRMVEWGILAVVIVVLAGIFGYYVQVIKGQAERASVLSTLGALRTALVVDHLQRAASGAAQRPAAASSNPFLILKTLPPNYRGEMDITQTLQAPPGGWVFDPQSASVGYSPQDPQGQSAAPGVGVLWFQVGGGPGPRGLTAQAQYVWQGLLVN